MKPRYRYNWKTNGFDRIYRDFSYLLDRYVWTIYDPRDSGFTRVDHA